MALDANELYAETTRNEGPQYRPYDNGISIVKFAATGGSDDTLAVGTPVVRNRSTGFWTVWTAAANEQQSITIDATGGTFTLSFNGQETAALAYDITAAALKTALLLLGAFDEDDIAVTGGPGATAALVVEFKGRYQGQDVAALVSDPASLTGGAGTATVAVVNAGTNLTGIEGFVAPREVNRDAANEMLGLVMIRGEILGSDVVLPSGESQSDLDQALKDIFTVHGNRNLDINGLAGAK